jgi:hypothetical protein
MKIKEYVQSVGELVLLTIAAIFLKLAGVNPKMIKDRTPRMRIF